MTLYEQQIGDALLKRGWTLATAESCTGGLIAHRLTNIPGSSAYYIGSIIAYDNRIKQQFLTISEDLLIRYGAVSEPVAVQMAIAACDLFKTDLALSVTGIAGPGGSTPDKPVGLTYIALAGRTGLIGSQRFIWTFDREGNKQASAEAALQLLLENL
ncbi:MAG: CinA family protein [Anaerolineae bacterium]|jgi:PncC family amidohydrolase|nr:CinA family protein [Anaerolineae bacterium]